MTNKTQLQSSRFPSMLSDLMHSNQFLKIFSVYTLILSIITLIGLIVIANKSPTVITLNADGKILNSVSKPRVEVEIEEAVRHYLDKRYKWGPSNVLKNLKSSEAFILPSTLKAFQDAVSKVSRFSIEKNVSQTVYPEKISIDLQKKIAIISGDRITSIQGLKAAGDLNLEISFESATRSLENPWGVYITKEKEE